MTRLRRRGLPWWVWALLALLALIVLAGLGAFVYVRSLFGPAGGAPYTLTVKPGDSLSAVARTLEGRGIIKNARVLRYVMDRDGTASRLKEGAYDLSGAMDVGRVAKILAGPARIPVTVTKISTTSWKVIGTASSRISLSRSRRSRRRRSSSNSFMASR